MNKTETHSLDSGRTQTKQYHSTENWKDTQHDPNKSRSEPRFLFPIVEEWKQSTSNGDIE